MRNTVKHWLIAVLLLAGGCIPGLLQILALIADAVGTRSVTPTQALTFLGLVSLLCLCITAVGVLCPRNGYLWLIAAMVTALALTGACWQAELWALPQLRLYLQPLSQLLFVPPLPWIAFWAVTGLSLYGLDRLYDDRQPA